MWRVWQPFEELQRRGYVAEFAPIHGCPRCSRSGARPEEAIQSNAPWTCQKCGHVSRGSDSMEMVSELVATGRYNAVVTPRVIWPSGAASNFWINTMHKAGLAWVYETDDDVFSPRIVDRQSQLFEKERLKGRERLEWERQERIRFLSLCDGVIVSTQRLATIVRQYAPESTPVCVVPNAIDTAWFKTVLRGCTRVAPPLTIGWAGGTRQDADVIPLAEAWHNLAKRYPHVNFVVQGHIPAVLADAVPAERRYTLPWLELDEYPRGLLNIDIGCCALAPTVFNTSKSAIKWYEMTMAGLPCVVSPTVYGKEVVDGSTALVAMTAAEWEQHLARLIESAEERRRLQRAARRAVAAQHSLKTQWWRWLAAYERILEAFARKPRLLLPAAGQSALVRV